MTEDEFSRLDKISEPLRRYPYYVLIRLKKKICQKINMANFKTVFLKVDMKQDFENDFFKGNRNGR